MLRLLTSFGQVKRDYTKMLYINYIIIIIVNHIFIIEQQIHTILYTQSF